MRLEKRHNYVRKVAETATQMFITNDKVNVAGIVLAGSADFKNDLAQSDIFDQRLVAKVLTLPLTLTLTLALALTLTLTLTLSLTLTLTRRPRARASGPRRGHAAPPRAHAPRLCRSSK